MKGVKRPDGRGSEREDKSDAMQMEKQALEERVKSVDGELDRMRQTEGLGDRTRNREKARARVNRLMREVDKCIALLERQTETLAKKNESRDVAADVE